MNITVAINIYFYIMIARFFIYQFITVTIQLIETIY